MHNVALTKAGLVRKLVIVFLGLALFLLFGCHNQATDTESTSFFTPLSESVPYNETVLGDTSLFTAHNENNFGPFFHYVDQNAGTPQDEQAGFEENNDGEASPEINDTSSSVSNEPPLSMAQLKMLGGDCRLPSLSLKNKVIVNNLEYRIFVYCFLDILKRQDGAEQSATTDGEGRLLLVRYPEIPAVKHKKSALFFLSFATHTMLHKYGQSATTPEQQLLLLKRVFIAAKFRQLTVSEKEAAMNLIAEKGLKNAIRIFLGNWYLSSFYKNHFDYSKEPQPAYQSAKLWGQIKKGSSVVDGVHYSLATDSLKGFSIRGVSAGKQRSKQHLQFSDELAKSLVSTLSYTLNKFSYNFFVQYYVEKGLFEGGAQLPWWVQLLFPNYVSQNGAGQSIDIPIKIEGSDTVQQDIAVVEAASLYTTDGKISVKNPSEPDPNAAQWPEVGYVQHPLLSQINFSTTNSGQYQNCPRAALVNGLIDTRQWKEFIACVLNVYNLTSPNLDSYIFYSKQATLAFLLGQVETFTDAELRLNYSDIEIANILYTILTGRNLTSAEEYLVEQTMGDSDLSSLLTLLLAEWYHSAGSNVYNFENQIQVEKEKYVISGIVRDNNGNALSGVRVRLRDYNNQEVQQVFTESNGQFVIEYITEPLFESRRFHLEFNRSGYGSKSQPISLGLSKNIKVFEFMSFINSANLVAGGQVVSSDGLIEAKIPSFAMEDEKSFSISNLHTMVLSEFGSGAQLAFNITPDAEFYIPARIEVVIPTSYDSLKTHNGSWQALVKEFNNDGSHYWRLLRSFYDTVNRKLTIEAKHFSEFIIASVELECYNDDRITKCRRLLGGQYPLHPLAKVVDNSHRLVNFPQDTPSLITDANNYLTSKGFTTIPTDFSAILDFGLLPYTFSQQCFTPTGCSSIDITPHNTYEMSNSLGMTITSAQINATSKINMHAEACAVNERSVQPQLRLNEISELNANGSMGFEKTQEISFSCISNVPNKVCISLFSFRTWKVTRHCEDSYTNFTRCSSQLVLSGTAHLSNMQQRLTRNQSGYPIHFTPSGTEVRGSVSTSNVQKNFPIPLSHPNSTALAYNNDIRSLAATAYEIGITLALSQGGVTHIASIIGRNVTTLLNNRDSILDPHFDSATCKPSDDSATRILDLFQLANGRRANASGLAITPNGDMFTVGLALDSENNNNLILRKSSDGGSSWQNLSVFSNTLICSSEHGPGVHADASGNIYLYSICEQNFVPGSTSYRNIIAKSSDGGQSFAVLEGFDIALPPNTNGLRISDMYSIDNSLYFSGTVSEDLGGFSRNRGIVRKSNDGGSTWSNDDYDFQPIGWSSATTALAGNSSTLFSLSYVSQNSEPYQSSWFVRRSNSGVWQMADQFQYMNGGTTSPNRLAVSGNNVFVAGTALESLGNRRWLVRYSSNNGDSWQTIDNEAMGNMSDDAGAFASGFDHFGNYWVSGVTSQVFDLSIPIIHKLYNGNSWHRIDVSLDPQYLFVPRSITTGFNNSRSFFVGFGFIQQEGSTLPDINNPAWEVREILQNVHGEVLP